MVIDVAPRVVGLGPIADSTVVETRLVEAQRYAFRRTSSVVLEKVPV